MERYTTFGSRIKRLQELIGQQVSEQRVADINNLLAQEESSRDALFTSYVDEFFVLEDNFIYDNPVRVTPVLAGTAARNPMIQINRQARQLAGQSVENILSSAESDVVSEIYISASEARNDPVLERIFLERRAQNIIDKVNTRLSQLPVGGGDFSNPQQSINAVIERQAISELRTTEELRLRQYAAKDAAACQ